MTGLVGSAGTAGDGYRVEPGPHPFAAALPEYGLRVVCRVCDRTEVEHLVPRQREAS